MTTNDNIDRDLDTLMALAMAIGTEEAKHMQTTPEIERDAHALATFTRDANGQVTGLVIHQGGSELSARKVQR